VCRICEETIEANHLDEHTMYCQSVHQLDNKTATTDVRLRKFVDALRLRRENLQQVDDGQKDYAEQLMTLVLR
jgi:hypothetical protein